MPLELGTLEIQITAAAFIRSRLAALQTNPICPPDAQFGIQVQRIKVTGITMRKSAQRNFNVFYKDSHLSSFDDDTLVTPYPATGFQAQMVAAVSIDAVRSSKIAENPNSLPLNEFIFALSVVIDLDCLPAASGLVISTTLADVEYAADAIPAAVSALASADTIKQELRRVISSSLSLKAIPLDVSGILPVGKNFLNAGLALDVSGTRLALRGEAAPGNTYNNLRWTNFRSGNFDDLIGSHDWAVVIAANDFKNALSTQVWQSLGIALSQTQPQRARLVTVDCTYSAAPGLATFKITVVLDADYIVYTRRLELPIYLRLTLDPDKNELNFNLDASKVGEFVEGVIDFARAFLGLLLPPFVSVFMLNSIVDPLTGLENTIGDMEVRKGTKFEEIPGSPWYYRLSLALTNNTMFKGRFVELIAMQDRFSIAGTLSTSNLSESSMTLDVGQFAWIAPKTSCNVGVGVLQDIRNNPRAFATLRSQIEVGVTGSRPVKLCSLRLLNTVQFRVVQDDGTVLMVDSVVVSPITTPRLLPTNIELVAAYALPDHPETPPTVLEVRTSEGVFHVKLNQPSPPSDADIQLMVDILEIRLKACQVALPPWFRGDEDLKVDWFDHGLEDPDYDTIHNVHIDVVGLRSGAQLLAVTKDTVLGGTVASVTGQAALELVLNSNDSDAAFRIQGNDIAEKQFSPILGLTQTVPTFTYRSQLISPASRMVLARPVIGVAHTPSLGGSHFAFLQENSCAVVDASSLMHPQVEERWDIPGVRGLADGPGGAVAYGAAGIIALSGSLRTGRQRMLRQSPVDFVGIVDGKYCVIAGDRLEVCGADLVPTSVIPLAGGEQAVGLSRGGLVVSSDAGTFEIKLRGFEPNVVRVDRGSIFRSFSQSAFHQSLRGKLQTGHWIDVVAAEHDQVVHARSNAIKEPWDRLTASNGTKLVRIGDSRTELQFYEIGPWTESSPIGVASNG